MGRSWASVLTSISTASSSTGEVRSNPILAVIMLDTRQADHQLKGALREPTELRATINTSLRTYTQPENLVMEGIKSAPGHTIKAFVDKKESVEQLREDQGWLKPPPCVQLQGAQVSCLIDSFSVGYSHAASPISTNCIRDDLNTDEATHKCQQMQAFEGVHASRASHNALTPNKNSIEYNPGQAKILESEWRLGIDWNRQQDKWIRHGPHN
ncbi:hypothetical protein FE257_012322 [Aspergillus nanangensis]|uniref:Uncharacterized protein n=1 Tax=Aspergillus nanangensis TaxID=2582783 RepID=A0AAD4GQU1_ASPNN|nr:hypothetical protein FE257_012322 [Aspergillus nanangensis]